MNAILNTLGIFLVELIKFIVFPMLTWSWKFITRRIFWFGLALITIIIKFAAFSGNSDPFSRKNLDEFKVGVGYMVDTIESNELYQNVVNTNTVKGLKKDINYVSKKVDDFAEGSDTYKGLKKDLGRE